MRHQKLVINIEDTVQDIRQLQSTYTGSLYYTRNTTHGPSHTRHYTTHGAPHKTVHPKEDVFIATQQLRSVVQEEGREVGKGEIQRDTFKRNKGKQV